MIKDSLNDVRISGNSNNTHSAQTNGGCNGWDFQQRVIQYTSVFHISIGGGWEEIMGTVYLIAAEAPV
jgi:hypothetical protein